MNSTQHNSTYQTIHELDRAVITFFFITMCYCSVAYIVANAIIVILHHKDWPIIAVNIFILGFFLLFISLDGELTIK